MIDQQTVGLLMVILLGVLLISGMSIGLSLAFAGVVGLLLTRGWMSADYVLGSFPYSYTADIAYIVLPLFLFMGQMAFVSGISERAFTAAERIVGHISGGLAIATVAASAGFAMVCGSSIASASTIGKVAIPEMLKRGYANSLAAGCVAAGGTLGILIPPSGMLVIYSIATGTSLVQLFVAALIPGFLTALLYGLMIYGMVKFKPHLAGGANRPRPAIGRVRAILGAWEIAVLFSAVMGTIYLGIATPTEASAIGAVVATMLALKEPGNRLSIVRSALLETGSATASIFVLILGAGLFSVALSTTQIPVQIASWISSLSESRYVILVLLLLPYFVMGMFIDGISMVLLTMPIVFPIIRHLNFDPVWFGIIVTKTVEIGLLTPPVGLNAFVVRNVAPQIPLTDIFRGCVPFVIMEIFIVALLIIFPELTMIGR